MPKDDWAKARAKDTARLSLNAAPDGDSVRAPRQRRKPKRKTKTNRQPAKPCRHCGSSETQKTPVLFKDGSHHIEVRCKACGRFIQYAKQHLENDVNYHETRHLHQTTHCDVMRIGKNRGMRYTIVGPPAWGVGRAGRQPAIAAPSVESRLQDHRNSAETGVKQPAISTAQRLLLSVLYTWRST